MLLWSSDSQQHFLLGCTDTSLLIFAAATRLTGCDLSHSCAARASRTLQLEGCRKCQPCSNTGPEHRRRSRLRWRVQPRTPSALSLLFLYTLTAGQNLGATGSAAAMITNTHSPCAWVSSFSWWR